MTAAQDSAEVALRELRHRFKNLLAVVNALASQTIRSATSIEEAEAHLGERLGAMGRAVDLLLQRDWRPVHLSELIELSLGQAPAFGERIRMSGPEVVIGPTLVMPLVLALHELETNALKYGALSNDVGVVTVTWETVHAGEPLVELRWTESGGPEIERSGGPGFGTRLATTLLQRRTGGTVALELPSSGLTWRMTAPLSQLSAT